MRVLMACLVLAAVDSPARAFCDSSQVSEGAVRASVFYTGHPLGFSIPSTYLFGGWLYYVQNLDLSYWPCGMLALLSMLLLSRRFVSKVAWASLSVGVLFLFSAILTFKLLEGWDELFIHVKHAESVALTSRYSYNRGLLQEASGEFLPLFSAGMLAKLGLPVTETLLSCGLIGSLWLLIVGWRIFSRITESPPATLVYCSGLAVFPAVVLSSMSGFFSTLFSAALLNVFYLLWLSPSASARRRGLILLSFLTLFRVEGIVFTFIIWLIVFVFAQVPRLIRQGERFQVIREAVRWGVVLSAPFFLACLGRFIAFGYPLPPPAAMKAAQGDPAYLEVGWNYLRMVRYAFNIDEILLVAIPLAVYLSWRHMMPRALVIGFMAFSFFSVPYVLGGGDWFPPSWARYFMPWVLSVYILWWGTLSIVAHRWTKSCPFLQPILAFVLVAVPFVVGRSLSDPDNGRTAFHDIRRLSADKQVRWERIDRLGFLGRFLDFTTPLHARIASPEEATIMYHAKRDAVDLTGFASPEIAYSPRQPLSPGDRMHRKRNPFVLLKYKPEVIAFWEPGHIQSNPFHFSSKEEAFGTLVNIFRMAGFRQEQIDVAYYRAGSYRYLEKLGYHFFVTGSPTAVFFYWVHESALAHHIKRLERLGGEKLGEEILRYRVSPSVSERFSSGEELIPPA